MRKIISLILCLISIQAFSQELPEVGLSFSTGKSDLTSFAKTVGGPGYSGDGFYSFGISYLRPINSWLSFESGLEFSSYKITITPNLMLIYGGVVRHEKINMLTLPIVYRVNFLKYAFVNGGLLVDLDSGLSNSVDSQTGIGALLGFGLRYPFKSGISISASPCLKVHSIFAFSSGGNHARLVDTGIKIGIAKKF